MRIETKNFRRKFREHTAAVASLCLCAALPLDLTSAAESDLNCDSVVDPQQVQSVKDARAYAALSWLQIGPDWHTSFSTKATVQNPFDVSRTSEPSPPVRGQIWARDVVCKIKPLAEGQGYAVLFTATKVRFKDGRSPWSKPQKNGVLIALEVIGTQDAREIRDSSEGLSVVLPDSVLRVPTPDDLPGLAKWPDPRCAMPKYWDGKACVAQQSGSTSH